VEREGWGAGFRCFGLDFVEEKGGESGFGFWEWVLEDCWEVGMELLLLDYDQPSCTINPFISTDPNP